MERKMTVHEITTKQQGAEFLAMTLPKNHYKRVVWNNELTDLIAANLGGRRFVLTDKPDLNEIEIEKRVEIDGVMYGGYEILSYDVRAKK